MSQNERGVNDKRKSLDFDILKRATLLHQSDNILQIHFSVSDNLVATLSI